MAPLVLIAVAVGTALFLQRRRPRTQAIASRSGPPAGRLPILKDGFVLSSDCKRLRVTDPARLEANLRSAFRSNILYGGPRFVAGSQAADQHARTFLSSAFTRAAPNCLPTAQMTAEQQGSETIFHAPATGSYYLPVRATLAQQIMYAYVFAAFAALLLEEKRWTPEQAAAETAAVMQMLQLNKISPADWSTTFEGTVPMPKELEA